MNSHLEELFSVLPENSHVIACNCPNMIFILPFAVYITAACNNHYFSLLSKSQTGIPLSSRCFVVSSHQIHCSIALHYSLLMLFCHNTVTVHNKVQCHSPLCNLIAWWFTVHDPQCIIVQLEFKLDWFAYIIHQKLELKAQKILHPLLPSKCLLHTTRELHPLGLSYSSSPYNP